MKPGSLRRFACPQGPGDYWIAAAIAISNATGAVQLALERHRDSAALRSQGLLTLLQGWLESESDFETTWDSSFGRTMQALGTDEVDPVDALAEVALRLAAQGHPGTWTAAFSEPRRHRWGGRWLLPAAHEISVDSDGTTASLGITGPDGKRSNALLRRGVDQEWQTDNADRLIQVGELRAITLLSTDAVPRDLIIEDDFHAIFEFPPVTPALAEPFSAALAILQQHTPEYLEWVERVLRCMVVCRCPHSRTRSSSWVHAPGVVLVSISANPVEVAEMLVHECSHQYFHLASCLGPVTDGSDSRLYYSPAVQRDRPLGKILVAYHAFANMLLFYRTLLRRDLADDPYCVQMEARLSAELEHLEGPLRGNPALTAAGADLCEPLMEQLRAFH